MLSWIDRKRARKRQIDVKWDRQEESYERIDRCLVGQIGRELGKNRQMLSRIGGKRARKRQIDVKLERQTVRQEIEEFIE